MQQLTCETEKDIRTGSVGLCMNTEKCKQWRDQVKYLGCMLRCKSCDTSSFVSKFYGAFNSIMHVLGYKRNEMAAVQLARSYCCLLSLLYGCEL